MAYVVRLTDGTTTVDLNDLSAFYIRPGTFLAPPPPPRVSMSGATYFREGQRVQAITYGNRGVSMQLRVTGTSVDNLIANIQGVYDLLRKADEFSATGIGAQVQLRFQWNSATNVLFFNVLHGQFDLGSDMLDFTLSINTTLLTARLTLVCEPYAVGAAETIENYLDDPGFEFDTGSVKFSDWTVANGTRAFDTSSPPEGVNWGKLTSNTSGNKLQVSQQKTMVAGNHVFTCKYKYTGDQPAEAFITDGGGGYTVGALTEDGTERTITVTRDSGAETSITCGIRHVSNNTDTNDILLMDKAHLGDGTTAPVVWVSSRNVFNNYEDGAGGLVQSKVNFIDIESLPGDVLGLLQLKAAENEAHTRFWLGARHDGRQRDAGLWHEGEGFATEADVTDAAASSGQVARVRNGIEYDAASSTSTNAGHTTSSHSHTIAAGDARILIVGVTWEDASSVISSVTYNTVAMTALTQRTNGTSYAQWFYMLETDLPASGANTVLVTFDLSTDRSVVGALSWDGVIQSAPAETGATGTSTDVTVDVTTVANDDVAMNAIHTVNGGGLAPGTGTTQRWDLGPGNAFTGFGGTEKATGTSTTINATQAASHNWAITAVRIQPMNLEGTAAAPIILTKSVSTPPAGLYRVLARVSSVDAVAWNLSMGYSYGGVTSDPAVAADYPASQAVAAFAIADLGTITIPPIAIPVGQTGASIILRLALYPTGGSNDAFDIDWVFLQPADQGDGYIAKTSAQDVVLADTRSPLRSYMLLNTSDVVQSRPPDQGGDAPLVHPNGTRIYLVSDNGAADIDDGWTVGITLVDRHLMVK